MSLDSHRVVPAANSIYMRTDGAPLQLRMVPSKPPGPWRRLKADGVTPEWWDLERKDYSHGSMVGVKLNTQYDNGYVQLYVYVDNPYDPVAEASSYESWDYWKQVDLDFPKIDPRTGKPFDQFLDWYSPLAR